MHAIALLVYAVIVTVTSLLPGGASDLDQLDKLVHLLVYYIFAVLAYRALDNKERYAYVCLGIIVYSALLEVGQSYVPGRLMSGYDLLANILGVALGAAVMNRRYAGR
jgi:VanZ family protein